MTQRSDQRSLLGQTLQSDSEISTSLEDLSIPTSHDLIDNSPPTQNSSSAPTFFLSFPTSVKLILFNELTERFAYYGNRAILTLFLTSIDFHVDKAVLIFSFQSALAYTMPLFGGYISDVWLGRYWTIVSFSCIYLLGAILLAFSANETFIDSKSNPIWVYVALLLTALGTGGIKPCVSTFGAEQVMDITQTGKNKIKKAQSIHLQDHDNYDIDSDEGDDLDYSDCSTESEKNDQKSHINRVNSSLSLSESNVLNPHDDSHSFNNIHQVSSTSQDIHALSQESQPQPAISSESFFITFYFAMNLGSIGATILIPIIRSRVSYFWAFMLPAMVMFISIVILLIGHMFNQFKLTPPDGSILPKIWNIISRTCKRRQWAKRSFIIPTPPPATQAFSTNQSFNSQSHDSDDFHYGGSSTQPKRRNTPTSDLSNDSTTSNGEQYAHLTTYSTGIPAITVNVHDFVRFVHLNYDYLIYRTYHPLFETLVDSETGVPTGQVVQPAEFDSTSTPDDQISYEYPTWLVPSYTCPYDTQQSQSYFTSLTTTTNSQVAQDGALPTSINYGTVCLCSPGCTCGCQCNTPQADPLAQNTTRPESFPSPCQCTSPNPSNTTTLTPINPRLQIKSSNVKLSRCSIRNRPSPNIYAQFTSHNDAQPSASTQFNQQPSSNTKSKWLCFSRRTQLHSVFPILDLASDEYSVLDYLDEDLFRYTNSSTPITIDDLCLPLSYKTGENYLRQQTSNPTSQPSYQSPVPTTTQPQPTKSNSKPIHIRGSMIQAFRIVLIIIPVLCSLPVFWSLMNQQGSTWMVQAEAMDNNIYLFGLDKKGWQIEPEQLSIFNPIFLFILLPFLEYIFRKLKTSERQNNHQQQSSNTDLDSLTNSPTTPNTSMLQPETNSPQQSLSKPSTWSSPLNKMMLGMVVAAFAYLCAALVDYFITEAAKTLDVYGNPGKISIFWQIPQYLFVTIAEVLISVTGLYFVFDMSPPNMKSLITALYLFSSAVGDFLTGILYSTFESWGFSRLQMFLGFAVCILLNSLSVIVIKKLWGKLYKF